MNEITKAELIRLSELIDFIYQGALDPQVWNKILPALAEWLDSPMAMLFTPTVVPQSGGFYFNHGIPEMAMELWRTRYQSMDVWTSTAIANNRIQDGQIFTGDDNVPSQDLVKTIWYQELLSKIGIGQVLTNIIFGLNSTSSYPTVLAYYRSLDDNGFDDQDRFKSSLLLPHISRAMGMAIRLRNAEYQVATSLIALNSLPHGILLIGENEEVVFSNQAAEQILNLNDGLYLQARKNERVGTYLMASQSTVQSSLDEAIRESIKPNVLATAHFSKALAIPRPSRQQILSLNFSSLPPQHDFAVGSHLMPRAVVFISDSAAKIEINHALLKEAYALTKAEIRTAEWLLEGKNLEQVSVEFGLSVNTLKTHLQHIYEKTNTSNRATLVKLLIALRGNKL